MGAGLPIAASGNDNDNDNGGTGNASATAPHIQGGTATGRTMSALQSMLVAEPQCDPANPPTLLIDANGDAA